MPKPLLHKYIEVASRAKYYGHIGSCTAKALAMVADISYDESINIAIKAGWKNKKGVPSVKVINTFNEDCGPKFTKVPESKISVSTFLKKYPKGRFYVRYKGHAFAVIDGHPYGITENEMRKFVCGIWKMEN